MVIIIGILNDISTYLSSLEWLLHEIQNQIRKYDNDLSAARTRIFKMQFLFAEWPAES